MLDEDFRRRMALAKAQDACKYYQSGPYRSEIIYNRDFVRRITRQFVGKGRR